MRDIATQPRDVSGQSINEERRKQHEERFRLQ